MTPDQGQRFMFDGHPVRGQMACIETTLAEVFGRHSYPLGSLSNWERRWSPSRC